MTVDSSTGCVLEGVVNQHLRVGLLMALATDSVAYYTHAEVPSLQPFITDAR